MSNREETLREIDGSDIVMRDLVKDITGKELHPTVASDLNALMPVGGDRKAPPKTIRGQERGNRKSKKRLSKRSRQAAKLKEEEERFSNLMVKIKAGDPNAPGYEARLRGAKFSTRLREQLPKTAQKKWANKEFQQRMEDRGFIYNYGEWKGWLPYETAKELQQKLIGAKSRGEYEVYMKLFVIRFLPARPDRVYGEHWKGWTDFLGTTNVFGHMRKESVVKEDYRSFYEALTFARSLKLKSQRAWVTACKDGKVPIDIPIDPHNVYSEFVDIDHWLGNVKAVEVITGERVFPEVWVLYTDGREDACWWAKMTTEKYGEFKNIPEISIVRAYEFEASLSDQVWEIFDSLSEVYDTDQRERLIEGNALFEITEQLNSILKWIPR